MKSLNEAASGRASNADGASDVESRRNQLSVIFVGSLVQGLAFVAVPAASNTFQGDDSFRLTSAEYGSLFVPMVMFAILTSTLCVGMLRRWGVKNVFLIGMAGNAASMSLVASSQFVADYHDAAYVMLLGAMGLLGMGLGTTITALNVHSLDMFPSRPSVGITALHTTLGSGNALGPILAAVFLALGSWWLLPVTIATVFGLTFAGVVRQASWTERVLPDPVDTPRPVANSIPLIFWGFAVLAVLYGATETIFSSWGTTFLHQDRGLSDHVADFALSAFWAMLMIGRIAVTLICTRFSPRLIYLGMPALMLSAFLVVPHVRGDVASIAVFGFAGLAFSGFFPLTLNFASQRLAGMANLTSGGLIAAVNAGIGFGAFGVGPLRSLVDLSTIYTSGSVVVIVIALLAFALADRRELLLQTA